MREFGTDKGGEGVQNPENLADVIYAKLCTLLLSGSKHKKVVANLIKRGEMESSPALGSPLPTDLPSSIIFVKDPETGAPAGGYKCKACDCVLNSDDQLRSVRVLFIA